MSIASKSAVRNAQHIIPKEAYRFIAFMSGYKRIISLTNLFEFKRPCSVQKLSSILSFYEYWKVNEAFSYINNNGVFDIWQHSYYYRALVDLINSEEYLLLNSIQRNKIIEEQNRISKQIHNEL